MVKLAENDGMPPGSKIAFLKCKGERKAPQKRTLTEGYHFFWIPDLLWIKRSTA